MRGLHAALIVLAGVAVANIGNYAFHVLAAQLLGPDSYGGVVSLLTLSGLISLPLAGAQLAVARAVAAHDGRGDREAIGRLMTRGVVLALAVGGLIAMLMAVLSPAIAQVLDVGSRSAIVITAVITIPAVTMPVVSGSRPGLAAIRVARRFDGARHHPEDAPFLVFFALGARTTGAVLATLLAASIALGATLWPLPYCREAREADGGRRRGKRAPTRPGHPRASRVHRTDFRRRARRQDSVLEPRRRHLRRCISHRPRRPLSSRCDRNGAAAKGFGTGAREP